MEGCRLGKLVSPARRREMVENAMENYGVSERKACRVLSQCRATQRYEPKQVDDEELLRNCVIFLSKSGHKESDEYNHFWRCSLWEGNVISIQRSIKLKPSV